MLLLSSKMFVLEGISHEAGGGGGEGLVFTPCSF